ncbi:thioredoxin family protein [Clostridium saccharobutylicum]|uniref:Thioredoxin domain protein n=1 Tax=Clostridium saccharobutylicum DSM 13864 TaxID=1345695 RepID=U5MV58_CLOSA|nr:thioredoxin family protein [Clostridium saccharobutylicum]AGX43526.1 thioredoxin domain protein [Clostridium saccharobutylicum DSM 13864]AQR90823.1 thioredoxin-like protein YtpP [Clostridium saccharobutylicum]AQS00727.1 thioredoxin-like protein YtpP [Clostridium saccharobutylicum]AQS14710.1 thioredoxin-like protein YtpP [Clostridium saccharobutylicum]MBA2906372.1 thiol-disulfide isomerase/thioredoxin [Clostridium saccharobutylicum]
MNKLHKDSEIEELIKSNSMSVIYFTGSDCGACEVIKIKIEDILKRFPKIKSGEINTQKHLDLAAKYNIFSVPVFILFIEGKESIRVGRNINLLELELNIKRYYDMIF